MWPVTGAKVRTLIQFDKLKLTSAEEIRNHSQYPEIVAIALEIFRKNSLKLKKSPLYENLSSKRLLENRLVSLDNIAPEDILNFIEDDIDAIVINAYLSPKHVPFNVKEELVIGLPVTMALGLLIGGSFHLFLSERSLEENALFFGLLTGYAYISSSWRDYRSAPKKWISYIDDGNYNYEIGEAARQRQFE